MGHDNSRASHGTGAAPPDADVQALYSALVESAEDAIFTKRLDGTITSWNPGAIRLYGYLPEEIVGRSVTILAPPDHPDEIPSILARIAAGERIEHFETERLHKDGSRRHVALTISPIRNRDGEIVAASTVARDITARKSAESQLLQAQKLESVGRLAGGIAHDFNNMLTAIRGYADMLTDDLSPDRLSEPDLAASLQSVVGISYAAERASALTGQLLAFSRHRAVTPKVVELNAGIREVEPMLRRLIGEDLRLVFKLDPSAGNVIADPGQLDQILINLVVNARDAMPDGGTISIETANVEFDEPYALEHFEVKPGPYVMLAVSDTGVGMDRETRAHIFEPFYTTKDVGMGTGLGLATTYGIVGQAGGHIWLYSEPGVGTTFKLYFPRVDAAVTIEDEAGQSPVGTQTGVVMVVEDEPLVRAVTTMLLERAGYKAVVVGDGVEAAAAIEKMTDPIDVLVTDVIMPKMSGIALCDWVLDRFPRIGVVLVSGYTAETLDLDRITARGAIFLSKPFTSQQLLRAVGRARTTEQANH
jgi:PAS domain S-box-containing protein